jgi:thiosulfate dehydrogenase
MAAKRSTSTHSRFPFAAHSPGGMIVRALLIAAVVLGAPFTASGGSADVPAPSVVAATATYPPGPEGAVLKRARALLDNTPALLPKNVGGSLTCSSCHVAGGTQTKAFAFTGIYATFPQYNARAKRFITVQDRIEECFLYSMNGKALDYTSPDMIAMTAYIAFLSRGAVVGRGFPDVKMPTVTASASPHPVHGAVVYTANCSACHGANGAGVPGAFPALWGAKSFNTGAGMHRVTTLASFVHNNMPPNGAKPLSAEESLDVAAFIMSKPRPLFQGNAPQIFQPEPAKFF